MRLLTTLALTLTATLAPTQDLAIKGATILDGDGRTTTDGLVLIQGGRIVASPAGGTMPAGLKVIDGKGLYITPGLIDAGSALGLHHINLAEECREVTPAISVTDGFDPYADGFQTALMGGVTTVGVIPGRGNVITGLSAVYRLTGPLGRAELLRRDQALVATMGREPARRNRRMNRSIRFRRPTTRMATTWLFRKAFADAGKVKGDKANRATKVLHRALAGKLPLRIAAGPEYDISTALRLAAEFKLTIAAIDDGSEAWRQATLLKKAGVPVVFGPLSTASTRDEAIFKVDQIARLARTGVPFAIRADRLPLAKPLITEARLALRFGLTREQALRAITLTPARILGVDDKVGSLAPGKDGDLVIWNGDPLNPTSRALCVIVRGRLSTGQLPGRKGGSL